MVRPQLLERDSKGRLSGDPADGTGWVNDAVQVRDLTVILALDALLRAQRDGAETCYVNAVAHKRPPLPTGGPSGARVRTAE
ncbi:MULTISPECIES: hypothetical protein [unclassified Streptomyces]|uniref:hypothetical protein n=1 Tax=unclassified Streptomyces TaxID=2593676 RepID=UPI003654E22F